MPEFVVSFFFFLFSIFFFHSFFFLFLSVSENKRNYALTILVVCIVSFKLFYPYQTAVVERTACHAGPEFVRGAC